MDVRHAALVVCAPFDPCCTAAPRVAALGTIPFVGPIGGTGGDPAERIALRLAGRIGHDQLARFFGGGRSLKLDGRTLRVDAPTGFAAALLDRRFKELLVDAAREELGEGPVEVSFRINGEEAVTGPAATDRHGQRPRPAPRSGRSARASDRQTDPRLVFSSLVIGPSNRLASEAAARFASSGVKRAASLLTLVGPCGMGKTHILHAAAELARQQEDGQTVKVTTGEGFTCGFVSAVRPGQRGNSKMESHRREHRGADLLCIDDLGSVADKPATLVELLHTLDAVMSRGGRVMATLADHPRRVSGLGEALTSRLCGGLVVTIAPADREMRARLACSIAARHGLILDASAGVYLADAALGRDGRGSAREIEGLVLKVEAVRRLLGGMGAPAPHNRVGVLGVQRALEAASGRRSSSGADGGGQGGVPNGPVRFAEILARVCEEVGVLPDDVLGRGRKKPVVLARSLCGYVARKATRMSYPEIARELARPNHSTVITACQRVERLIGDGGVAIMAEGRGTPLLAALAERLVAVLKR